MHPLKKKVVMMRIGFHLGEYQSNFVQFYLYNYFLIYFYYIFRSTRSESSDGIVFENADGTSQVDSISIKDESQSDTNLENKSDNQGPREIQFMYIQMEFCEKSTLRTAIDTNLFEDQERLWRLFTEVVEGLAHIHQQGMIHRDLKPVNIFLDNNDQVKIGDFGLATTNILPRQEKYKFNIIIIII